MLAHKNFIHNKILSTEATLEFNELFLSIVNLNDTTNCNFTKLDDKNLQVKFQKCGLKWKEISSFSEGRCYTIEFIRNITINQTLDVILKFPIKFVSKFCTSHR